MNHLILRYNVWILICIFIFSCSNKATHNAENTTLKIGIWRAILQSPGGELPFSLDISPKTDSTFEVFAINGEERLPLDEAKIKGDSLHIPIELFDSEIVAKIEDSTLTGRFTKYNPSRTTQMKFSAHYGLTYRFTNA